MKIIQKMEPKRNLSKYQAFTKTEIFSKLKFKHHKIQVILSLIITLEF
jgi:hypothetical protein